MGRITIGAASDPGMEKKENQDSYAYRSPTEGRARKKGILLALADGMGGHSGGSIASKTAIDSVMETYYSDASLGIPESLEKSFLKANSNVIQKGKDDLALQGLGSTLTTVVIKDDRMYFAHVGDSRGYSIYNQEISQFTEDHSYVASLVKAGVISAEEALTHPEDNIITKAIGFDEALTVDASDDNQPKLKVNQYILLCCDGLYKVVPDEEIKNMIYKFQEPDIISQKLVEMANANGGPDNITVLIARVDSIPFVSRVYGSFLSLLR
ncbi:MAG: Stp1/IreP family PP2C-type Ser/Thr phosphatase [Deltaproteobacteria bacterium]|nr:Stp1/IreP family PP2C-type Ser/Thr phosphatase [Deltaproteobacteria bacterium]